MRHYLCFIGVMNALGVLALLGCLREDVADRLLRRWCWIVPQDHPYTHSPYGRLWLWWAILGTAAFSAWNLAATTWPPELARQIILGDVCVYLGFEALAIAGSRSPRFGPGVHVAHVLWLGQAGWGIWTLCA